MRESGAIERRRPRIAQLPEEFDVRFSALSSSPAAERELV
jgi:hypothetical protein